MLLERAGANSTSLANPEMWSILMRLLVPRQNALQPKRPMGRRTRDPRCGR